MLKIQLKIQLHIHKKDLFLLPTATEVAFSTNNSPSPPNHPSLLRTARCGTYSFTE